MLSTTLLLAASMVVGQADAASPTAENYFEFMEYYVGDWKATTKTGDEVTHASVSIRWSLMKRCQVVKIVEGDRITRHALWGFDPRLKRWCGLAFNADGSQDFSVHDPTILKAKYGKPFRTKMKGANADGSPLTGVWTTTLIDEKTYEIEIHEIENDKLTLLFEIHLEKQH